MEKLWYGHSIVRFPLLPLSWVFCAFAELRRFIYRKGLRTVTRLNCEVVVVGNITTGGTGKTPLVIALAKRLQDAGFSVGILTRGYRAGARQWPRPVLPHSDPLELGDEAVLLARTSGTSVFAGPDRAAAGRALLETALCDVVICDDGLQHYGLHRDIEIAVVDAARGTGNGHCLPAGPLREPVSRLRTVDAVVSVNGTAGTGFAMEMELGVAHRVSDPAQIRSLESFRDAAVHAVAGIGNPERFFGMLRSAGLAIQPHRFADHHRYRQSDLDFGDDRPVLMTAKDAVKCERFAQARLWFVPVEVRLDPAFDAWLLKRLHHRHLN
jgi:tetraacyldisaccharide 4'-kinase